LARAVLNAKLAACVNIVPGIESHYWWQGRLATGKEYLLLIKTTEEKTAAVIKLIRQAHSYDTPEIIFTRIVRGERRYLHWIRQSVLLLLLTIGTTWADPFDDLVKQLGSPDEEVRVEAAGKIAQIGGPRAEKKFREMITADNPERRQIAVVGLLQVSDAAEDLERVRARLKDEVSLVRWSAAVALGQSGRREAIPWLEEVAQSDASAEVQEAAGEALAAIRSAIRWQPSLPAAQKASREGQRMVLVYFYVRGAEVCDRFESGVLRDPAVVAATEAFECVRLDVARESAEARRLDVRGAPTILVLDAQGNEVARAGGLTEKDKLIARLQAAQDGAWSFREARRQAQRDPNNVPANWKVAETFLEEGREDLAESYLRNVIGADEANRHGHTDQAMFALGYTYGKAGKHAAAVYCLEQLLHRFPQYPGRDKALYCLALSQLATGQKDKGRATLTTLVTEFPASAVANAGRQALQKLGEK
jgi:periplasmic divalent cation tolerance protein